MSGTDFRLLHLSRLDERLSAHLDGIAVAGEFGAQRALAALESPGIGAMFVVVSGAISVDGGSGLDRLFALVAALPEVQPGLLSAFGWASAYELRGLVRALLGSSHPFQRCVGLAACGMHRVDTGPVLTAFLEEQDAPLRGRALRCCGEVGRRDLAPLCLDHIGDDDPVCAFRAACSALLLGERGRAVDYLRRIALLPVEYGEIALRLILKIFDCADAHVLLKTLASDPANQRRLLRGAGIAGDASYLPWLIAQMSDPKKARLAGESFTLITGLDLAYLDLDNTRPKNVESGPNDNPDDDNVAMDEDDGLPWPDPVKLQAWWDGNHQRFEPGVRYFMGERVTVEHCKKVLRDGFQRQRVAAAEYLCLLTPGTPLFPTSAPAWRQQRWLRQMG